VERCFSALSLILTTDNLPSYLQTTIIAQMLSIGEETCVYIVDGAVRRC